MAATKTCPSCDAEVPLAAARCKDCFHDFNEKQGNSAAGPLILLGTLASIVVVFVVVLAVFFVPASPIYYEVVPLEERILVDEESRSVVWIKQYRSGPVTERLPWDRIASLQHVTSSGGDHTIVAVEIDGSKHIIQSSDGRALLSEADHYAKMMDKPMERVDETRGFGARAKREQEAEAPPAP